RRLCGSRPLRCGLRPIGWFRREGPGRVGYGRGSFNGARGGRGDHRSCRELEHPGCPRDRCFEWIDTPRGTVTRASWTGRPLNGPVQKGAIGHAPMRGVYRRYCAWVFAKPRRAALVLLVLCLPALAADVQFFSRVRTGIADLLPKDTPSVKAIDAIHA